jgi:hypothetical protein
MNGMSTRLARLIYRFSVANVRDRSELPFVLNARGLTGEGVEVGVQLAVFSCLILKSWRGRRLYSVDPWLEYDVGEYVDSSNVSQEVQDYIFHVAERELAAFGERSRIVRKRSLDAVREFADGQLDFVYIDAQHHFEAVRADLEAWWPKVRRGGLVAGHDYCDADNDCGRFGVRSAVNEFARRMGRKVHVTRELEYPSWILVV